MKRVLFVCGRAKQRSPTAEAIFASDSIETQSAGVSPDADSPLDADAIAWADVIVFMEAKHRAKAMRRFGSAMRGKKITCVRIPDRYAFMDEALIELLRERVRL